MVGGGTLSGTWREDTRTSQRDRSGDQVGGNPYLVGRDLDPVTRRAAPAPSESDRLAVDQERSAPDAVGLSACEGVLEALDAERTARADRLGPSDVEVVVGEEQWGERSGSVGAACSPNGEGLEVDVGIQAGGSVVHVIERTHGA